MTTKIEMAKRGRSSTFCVSSLKRKRHEIGLISSLRAKFSREPPPSHNEFEMVETSFCVSKRGSFLELMAKMLYVTYCM